ncbi:MAG: S41 family peptidase [Ferruginibacter sp.]
MRIQPIFFTILVASSSFFISCKKNTEVLATPPPATGAGSGSSGTASGGFNVDLLKDTALMYAKDVYLWNSQIPATFNARSYADPAAIMKAIQTYSLEPGFSQPVDKWSFAMKKTEWDQMSNGMSSTTIGSNGDFGLSVFFRSEGDLRIRLVEPNSPAGLAGVRRGWRITQINGNSNLTTGNASTIINDVYYSTSSSFTFTKPDGSSISKSFTAMHYTEKPVYLDSVYDMGSKKIGYLVYNSFLGNTTDISTKFQQVFSRFAAKQVTDVIIDLRYNGGGYVSLAEQLANYLAPASANGGLMMKQQYNSQNTQNNSTTYFQKRGTLNLPTIYFIVSKSSASASELLINTLKPYMNVKLIGPSATHGKPVGFFPISDGDWYVFPVSFRTMNKLGEGNYFNGLLLTAQVADGLDKDWGDVSESCLASAIRNITTGAFMPDRNEYKEQPIVDAGNVELDAPFLKITVDKK